MIDQTKELAEYKRKLADANRELTELLPIVEDLVMSNLRLSEAIMHRVLRLATETSYIELSKVSA